MSLRSRIDKILNHNRKRAATGIPESYVVIDIETTDLPKPGRDGKPDFACVHIVEIGWCVVIDRVVREQMATQMFLPHGITSSPAALRTHGYSSEHLTRIGGEPGAALRALRTLLATQWFGLPVVGQNIALFDIPCIEANWQRYGIQQSDAFRQHAVYDTLAIYQAAQPITWQDPDEHGIDFAARLRQSRRSSLDHQIEKYSVSETRGEHRADEDAFLTHCVFEAMRDDGTLALVTGRGKQQ